LALLALPAIAAELRSILRPDVAFLLYAADRVLHGARLYRDVVEINPPLIVGLNLPPVLLAHLLHLQPALPYRIGVVLLAGASLWATNRLLVTLIPGATAVRRGLVLCSTLVLLPMAAVDFGEREHLALALLLPYAWLIASRACRVAVPSALSALLGVLAGLGLALKPYFLLVWVGLELYRRLRAGRVLGSATPESIAVLAVLLGYSVVVLLFTPEYLELAAVLGPAYSHFLYKPASELLVAAPGAPLVYLAVFTYAALRRSARYPEIWDALLIAGLGFFLAGVLQQKGLRYHFYPAFGLATLLLGVAAVDCTGPVTALARHTYRIVALATVLTVAALSVGTAAVRVVQSGWSRPADVPFDRMVALVRRDAAGSSIFVFSHHIGSTFPLVNYAGVASASRFPHLWILAAEYLDRMGAPGPLRYRAEPEMSHAERYLNDAVYADLRRQAPALLLVLRNARDDPANGLRRFDYLAYFERQPRFAHLLAEYGFVEVLGEYLVFRRLHPGESPAGVPPAQRAALDVDLRSVAGAPLYGGDTLVPLGVFLAVLALLGLREWRRPAREPMTPA
jgi:hypothetical protein